MATRYDPTIIATIGSLDDAHAATVTEAFQNFLSAFETVAKEEGLNDVWGVTLVHRHSNVPSGHRLFDFGRTLQSFRIDDEADTLHGASIRPKSLALRESRWKPYEYELGHSNDETADFLEVVAGLISNAKLENYIGLRRYDPASDEELEITEQEDISLKIVMNEALESIDSKRTFWGFPSGPMKDYRCTCNNTGSATAPNHNHIDCN